MPKEAKDRPERGKPARAKPAAKAELAGKAIAKGKQPEQTPEKERAARSGTAVKASARPAAKRLEKVPEEYVFYCCDGGVYHDMAELAAGLSAMTDEVFAYHSNVEKHDFSNWVRDIIEDIELANDLAMAASRIQAARCVADRIVFLSR